MKEAIRHFESLQKRYTTQHNGKQCEYVKAALKAMRKRIEQKPIIQILKAGEDEEDKLIYWFCPECGTKLDVMLFEDRHNKYLKKMPKACYECQQLLDWSEEK